MAKKSPSITFTVFAGYLLLAALSAFAIWFVYEQVVSYTQMTDRNNTGNQKLLLVGEAATKLYEAESLSRQLIQSGDLEGLEIYTAKIDSIKMTLASLQRPDSEYSLEKEVDSINILLSQKSENLSELIKLRAQGESESYYNRVLNELRKVDETFDIPNYEQRFKDLEPHQRSLLIKLLDYANVENAEPANLTADSLVNAVKSVLSELEIRDRQYRTELRNKENALLENEIELNSRLRILLSTIEFEERQNSLQQVANWQDTVESTSKTIALLGAISLLVILIFVFLVTRDVSRSQRYRKQLENAKIYAESLLKSREQFMNTITHDLRSPLNSVVGYTGLLEKTDLDRSQNRYLDQLKRSSDYLLHLVNDLLDLSKLEAGKMSVDELTFNPKNLIEETVENAIPPEKPEEVEVLIEVEEELDRPVITDPFRIKQIITNLVSNACKFTQEGSVEVKAWLEEKKNKTILNIQVKDTGIGISAEQKEKVFEEFSQEDSSIEKRYGGSGLGLAISKKLTDLLKGNISLESEPGKGSTFLIEIPVKLASPVTEVVEPSKPTEDLQNYTVLLVDDEPAQLGLLKELIRSTGMKFYTARNGKEALKTLQKEKADLVLTDIQMPDMNGFQLLTEIKKISPELQVIALSGQPNVSPSDYLKKGFSGSLLKPYSSKKLLELIEDVLKIEFEKQTKKKGVNAGSKGNYTLNEIKTFAGEDQQALNAILTAFMESTATNIQVLKMAWANGDSPKVSAVAHKMLPMIRQLRVKGLVVDLEKLEKGKEEEIKKVDVPLLTKKIRSLLNELQLEIKD